MFKFLALLSFVFSLQAYKDMRGQIVARINGEPVYQEELNREMTRYRSAVPGYGSDHQQQLKLKAMKALRYIKVQEKQLFKDHLWPYHNYPEFLATLANTNTERRKAATAGQPLYGPVTYDETTFFDYCFSNSALKFQSSHHISDPDYRRQMSKRAAAAKVLMLPF
jgi:hypothetical protein